MLFKHGVDILSCTHKFTVIKQNVSTTVMPFNNSFRNVDRENFNKHFEKLIFTTFGIV